MNQKTAIYTAILALVAVVAISGCGPKTRKPVEGERVLRHEVAEGESLQQIADDYYGDAGRHDEIKEFNLLDSDDVKPGDVVRIYMTPEDMEVLGRRKKARIPYNAGLDLVSRGSYLDAIGKFKEAIELAPQFTEAIYNLGVTYQKLNAHDRAIDQFESAARMNSGNADYYFAIGNSYFHLEQYPEAVSSFERALKLDKRNLKAQYALATTLEKSGQTSRAIRAWRRYLDMDNDSEWAERARDRLAGLEQ
jgi:tetratricopeptide (TPR) repeat protein